MAKRQADEEKRKRIVIEIGEELGLEPETRYQLPS